MDINSLVRDPKYILSCLKEEEDKSVVALKPLKIQIPVRFSERNLAEIGVEIFIPGIYAIISDNKYGVSTVSSQLVIIPNKILKININDEPYYEFYFDVGNTVFKSTELIKKDTLVYYIFDELLSKCNIPWYLSYDDLGKIFDTAKYYADTSIADNNELTELIVAIISRDSIDKTIYYRSTINNEDYINKHPPEYVSLSNVIFSATNTITKISGSYFDQGVLSALVDPSERVERVEELLRS